MNLEYPDSHDLNFSNRLVRTRMPGGVAGARLTADPYADQSSEMFQPPPKAFTSCTLARRWRVLKSSAVRWD